MDYETVSPEDLGRSLHGDGTYGENPLLSLLPENPPRGPGVESRFYDTDPDAAVKRTEALEATILQPHCHISNHCETGVTKHPRHINAGFGLFFDAEFMGGQSIFPRFLQPGLTLEMKNFEVRKVRLN
jgi:hypothetical protein